MWADPCVVRYISGKPLTREDSWSRLLRYVGHWKLLGFGYWVVEDQQTGAFLGEVGFADFRREIEPSLEGTPEIGWVMATQAHGRGLATEAVTAAVAWGDVNLEAEKTACLVAPEHTASIRVAKKNGYSETLQTTYKGKPTLVMERNRHLC